MLGKLWHAERFESSIYIFTMFMFVPGVHSFRISDVPSSVDAKRVNQVPFIHGGKWQNPHCRSCLMKKNADHCSSIFMFAFSSYWICPVPGLSLQSPVVPGMHMPFPRKNLSSELQSHHLQPSRLDVARLAAALARIAGGLISRLLLSRCHVDQE